MGNDTPSHNPQPQPKPPVKPIEPLHQEQKTLPKTQALHKPNPYKQPQAQKYSKKNPYHKTTIQVHQRWVPKTLLQAQGFYKGKTSIWVPKQRQEQVQTTQAQAHKLLPKRLVKPNQESACTITNLESKTIQEKPRTTSQLKHQRTISILKQAQWILQLMQAKLSQATVV